jgi:lactate dehydrogenase-like 2-hydroxyacid dehydrogenase
MQVLLLDRKEASETSTRSGRIAFSVGLRTCTMFIITCPLTPATRNLISTPELEVMRKDAIVINVARGGIVDEEALVQALKEEKIAGAAADVFIKEPATFEDSALVRAANEDWVKGKLTLSPHVAWCARSSIEKLRGTVTLNVESWAKGEPVNLVE